ncbi:MAG: heparinase II/III family protein [Alphaproteobacteria bacterium]|nr:heparinase II/III family protein [Alphaproteobacteria bacterium]MBL6775892.1 heparinase II/III family protein [Alphaproteobacteria bacterium]
MDAKAMLFDPSEESVLTESDIWKISALEILYRQSRLFSWQLRSTPPQLPLPVIPDLWRGDAKIGAAILQGMMPFSADSETFARFDWVRDLRDYGGADARITARNMIDRWMQGHRHWSAMAWRPDILGARLANLIFTFGWFGASADEAFQTRFAAMVALQQRCLALDWQHLYAPLDQLTALKGLILSQLVQMPAANDIRRKREITALFDLLVSKVRGQINADGGHRSRQAEIHLDLLKLLIECRSVTRPLGITDMPILDDIIQKMAAMTKLWRDGSGHFSHFHFAGLSSAEDIDQVLSRCNAKGRITQHAPDTGFARISAARSTLIIDTGTTSDAPSFKGRYKDSLHNAASRLAFEFSVGNAPFIVNTGQGAAEPRLRTAFSQTAAHTALTLDGLDNQHKETRTLNFDIGPADGGFLMQATHDSYVKSHGILHTRQLFLSRDGNNLRGSDQLNYSGAPGQIPIEVIIRFHLHPQVSAARVKSKQILLKVHNQKAGWLFKCRGAETALDRSVYLDRNRRSSCQQIVLRCPASQIQTKGNLTINWAFTRHSS